MGLTILECSQLSDILRKRLGVQQSAYSTPMSFAAQGAAPAAAAPAGAPAAAAAEKKEEPKKEKTEFDIKLESFTAEGKIKVIKEIRTFTNLGLKEAKELVRGRCKPCGATRTCYSCQLALEDVRKCGSKAQVLLSSVRRWRRRRWSSRRVWPRRTQRRSRSSSRPVRNANVVA